MISCHNRWKVIVESMGPNVFHYGVLKAVLSSSSIVFICPANIATVSIETPRSNRSDPIIRRSGISIVFLSLRYVFLEDGFDFFFRYASD